MIRNDSVCRMLTRSWHAEPDQRPLFVELQGELLFLKQNNPSTKVQWRALEDLLPNM
jgi:hypothetical protein